MSYELSDPFFQKFEGCGPECPLCSLEQGKTTFRLQGRTMSTLKAFAQVTCDNGCCITSISLEDVDEVMKELDVALRWESSVKFSELCAKDPSRVASVPLILSHNVAKWNRSLIMDWEEVDEDLLWKEIT